MTRKILLAVLVILTGAWLVMWMGSAIIGTTLAERDDRSWPMGLGSIQEVRVRYPPAPASAGAWRLGEIVRPLGIEMKPRYQRSTPALSESYPNAITEYVTSQIQRANPVIDEPPPKVAEYLRVRAAHIDAARALILSGTLIAWAQDIEAGATAPMPRLSGHMQLTRVFVASALGRARRDDAGAWEDLRAAWQLNRGLFERPEIISSLIGLATARVVNGAARKMPLPAPQWLADLQRVDYRRAMLAAHQAEAWTIADRIKAETTSDVDSGDPMGGALARVRDTLLSPYTRVCTLDEFDRWRAMAIEVAARNECDLDPAELERMRRESIPWWNVPSRQMRMPNLASIWQRVFRFRAEIEATQRALELREGRPPRTQSDCTDGKWVYSAGGLQFSRRLTQGTVPVEFWMTK